jgi:hypothetical protein
MKQTKQEWIDEMSPINETPKEVKVILHTILEQTKRATPYEGDDIADFIHQNKYHRTSSEAYRDADYASWFESDPEMSDMKLFILEFMWIMPLIIGLLYLVKYVIM